MMKTTDLPIIVEETFETSVEKVWYAITDLSQMKQWFFQQLETFQAKEGFKTQFLVENEGRKFTHLWEIVEVIPLQKIKYNWRYLEYPGDSLVTFELMEENNRIRLRLTTEIVESFPTDLPEFKRESGVDGWNYFIKGRLKEFLS